MIFPYLCIAVSLSWIAEDRQFLEVFSGRGEVTNALRRAARICLATSTHGSPQYTNNFSIQKSIHLFTSLDDGNLNISQLVKFVWKKAAG